jgi:O-methyltransferase involved in polyketide biosynthesis
MYLTTDAIRKTLRAVASCGQGSQMVLTYNQPTSTLDAFSRTVTDILADAIGQVGEPFISVFTPEAAQASLRTKDFGTSRTTGAMKRGEITFRAARMC